MIKVRRGVFETNSSSTHSLTMCSRQEYDEWRRGERVYNADTEELELIGNFTEEELEDLNSENLFTFEGYEDCFASDYETFEQTYHTPAGDEVIGFGFYGYN